MNVGAIEALKNEIWPNSEPEEKGKQQNPEVTRKMGLGSKDHGWDSVGFEIC